MDELLKSYARKRQDEAGAPAEMHPATRRLLQAEIARLRPEPSAPKAAWWQNLVTLWPRLAFAAGVFVALGIATWQLTDSGGKAGFESQLAKQETAFEKALPIATEQGLLRDEKERMQLARDTDPQSRLPQDRVGTVGGRAGREVDGVSKLKDAEVAKTESAAAGERFYRSLAPAAPAPTLAPQAANKPAALAELEAGRRATIPPQQPAPALPPVNSGTPAKDVALVTLSTETLGKNLANEEAKRIPALASTPLNGGDVSLSVAANNQLNYTVTANSAANVAGADTRKQNNARLPGGVLPPTDVPAEQGLVNNASSLDAFYAANQSKAAAVPILQLSLNDNPGQALANNRETLLRQNNYEQSAALAAGRTVAPVAQASPSEGKSDQLATLGAKVATDKAVRDLNDAAPGRADSYAYANRGVAVQNANPYRQRFAQVPSAGQSTAFKKISTPDTKILSNFEVQRDGGQVRVVDADGSVYDGQVVADTSTLAVSVDDTRQMSRRTETRQQQPAASQQGGAYNVNAPNWAFRVSGTNRTLRQPVSLEGVMQVGQSQNQAAPPQIANRNGQAPARGAIAPQQPVQPSRRAGQTAGPATAYSEQLSNTSQLNTNASSLQRMQGRLRVGPNNQVELEAVPADN